MKYSNYPVVYNARTYPETFILYWSEKDICISVEKETYGYEFDGDFVRFINASCFIQEEKDKALAIVDEIKEQYEIYNKWTNSLSIEEVMNNLVYCPQGYSYTDLKIRDFVEAKMNIIVRGNEELKNFLNSEAIEVNCLNERTSVFALNGIPFILLYVPNDVQTEDYDHHGQFKILNQEIFEGFYNEVIEINAKNLLIELMEKNEPEFKLSPYEEGATIEKWETPYAYVDGEFIESTNPEETNFKKMI